MPENITVVSNLSVQPYLRLIKQYATINITIVKNKVKYKALFVPNDMATQQLWVNFLNQLPNASEFKKLFPILKWLETP